MISKDDIIKAKQKKKKVWSSPKVKLLTFVKLYCIYLFGRVGWALVGAQDARGILQALFLWRTDSLVVACGLRCSMACGILVPQPGIKSASPALQGGFLTAGPLSSVS